MMNVAECVLEKEELLMRRLKYLLILTTIGIVFGAGLVMASPNVVVTKTPTEIRVVVDGKIVNFPDQKPYIDSADRTLVPVRFPAETLGADVNWQESTREVFIKKEADDFLWASDIRLKIGDTKVTVNGETRIMDTVAVITNSRTMVPVRFISEYMGATVRWHVGSNAAHVFTYGQSEEEQNRIMEEIAKELQGLVPVEPKPVEPVEPVENQIETKLVDIPRSDDVFHKQYIENAGYKIGVTNNGVNDPGIWFGIGDETYPVKDIKAVCVSHPEWNTCSKIGWDGNYHTIQRDAWTNSFTMSKEGYSPTNPKSGDRVTFDVYGKVEGEEVKLATITKILP